MAVIGIGTDIVKVPRIKRLLDKRGLSFAERILHTHELTLFKTHSSAANYLAKRFAAKEALSKALGTGIAKGINFTDIEVVNNEDGKPHLILHGAALTIAEKLGVTHSFISLSDEKKYAIAYVVLEGTPKHA